MSFRFPILIVSLFALVPVAGAKSPKPNIIMIMADDMGYETVASNGCEDYETPHIDAMAKSGMRFTRSAPLRG